MSALRFGFSEEVVKHNINILVDSGRSRDTAERIAKNYAESSKKKHDKAKAKQRNE